MTAQNNNNQTDPNIDVTSPYTPRRPAPIVSISINHPIGTFLRKIKNFFTHKQTLFSTTFTIKVTPIVALVSLLGLGLVFGGGITTAFNFGKTVEQKFLATTPSPTPKIIVQTPVITTVSKTGIIKATYSLPSLTPTTVPTTIPTENPTSSSGEIIKQEQTITPTPTPSTGSGSSIPTSPLVLHYILSERSGEIIYLTSKNISLKNYVNLRVLITGNFDSSNNTLSIGHPEDIEVLR